MEFRTSQLGFAAYLMASKSLSLLRIEKQHSNAVLIFSDPNKQGPELELAFTSGEATVSAASYHAHLRGLRRKIESTVATQGGR
jgi:hypothetical protein